MSVERRKWTFKVPGSGIELIMESEIEPEQFKTLRKQINRDLAEVMVGTAQSVIVPKVNARAHFVKTVTGYGTVAKRGGYQSVYITTIAGTREAPKTRPLSRIAGMLEFGGLSRRPIGPSDSGTRRNVRTRTVRYKRGERLKARQVGHPELQGGVFSEGNRRMSFTNPSHAGAVKTPWGPRFIVMKPRRYKGKRLVVRAVGASRDAYGAQLKDRVLMLSANAGWEVE